MKLKQRLKNILGLKIWRFLKKLFGRLNLEEVDIVYELLKNSKSSNIMIDVGAHYGTSLEPFAEDGWNVFAFEPDIKNRKILNDTCKKYNNVTVDKRAVSNKDKEILSFYTSDVSSGISSLESFHKSHKETGLVETVTLESFMNENKIKDLTFLKIDTEGHDLFVLEGINWKKHKPEVVICEFEDRKTKPLGYSFDDLARYLTEKKYYLMISEWYPMLEYGHNHKWRQFGKYPYKLIDKKGWGNIIAVKNESLMKELEQISDLYAKKFRS